MTYVNLNPIRARVAQTPEESDFTSIQKRIKDLKSSTASFLAEFSGNEINTVTDGVTYHLHVYIELVEWTGRATRNDKRGSLCNKLPPILERLGLDEAGWITFATGVESHFGNWVGSPESFATASENIG